MERTMRVLLAAAGGVAGSAAAAVAVGGALWDRATVQAVGRLLRGGPPPRPAVFTREQLVGLPEPVARYFVWALAPGQALIRSACIEHAGEFRSGGFDAPWKPFTSVQHVATAPPGFVWDASIRMAPLLPVRVRDSYLGGGGSMQARLAAVIPVVDQRGGPELAAGALQRYLGEAPWVPTALLPGSGVRWEGIDEATARATLVDGEVSVSLEFQFGEEGAITRSFTSERYREVAGAYVPTPWEATYEGYREVEGMRVPMAGEVAWLLPEGRLAYWRGRIRRIAYEWEIG